jgi:hypothetical protein
MQFRRRAFTWGIALVALVLIGCGKSESASPGGPAPAGGTSASPTASKANLIYGKVSEDAGKPITAPGAKITISIYGISSKSGEKVYYNPVIKPDGSFEQKVVDGSYQISSANIDVPFNGKHFLFALEPVGDDKAMRDSAPGIEQNYVWKLTGLIPGHDADESNFTNWHGASVKMQFQSYRNDIKKSVSNPPAGTKALFTLTPTGKLVDGSEGKPLTFTRDYDPLMGGLKNGNLPNLPLADYTVKGEEVAPDGSTKPLLMQQAFAKFGESAEVHFAPGSSSGAWPANVGFTRGE